MDSRLSHCGLQSKPLLQLDHPVVCLLSMRRLQEGVVGSSPLDLLMEGPTYRAELPLAQEGPQ